MEIYASILFLRPNNWYLNAEKVQYVRNTWQREEQHTLPLPLVTTIDGELALIDGHSRVFVAFENGEDAIKVEYVKLEDIEGSSALYQHIHRASPLRGIQSIVDLHDRIVSAEQHKELWVGYCETWLQAQAAETRETGDQ
jgi:hypothetical protein